MAGETLDIPEYFSEGPSAPPLEEDMLDMLDRPLMNGPARASSPMHRKNSASDKTSDEDSGLRERTNFKSDKNPSSVKKPSDNRTLKPIGNRTPRSSYHTPATGAVKPGIGVSRAAKPGCSSENRAAKDSEGRELH